jgi:hypothetical protein
MRKRLSLIAAVVGLAALDLLQYMAAELDRQAALNFYGGFGVRRIWY